ncbi:MAG: ribonuclease HI [Clostridia bacterium]|nr:ribonuclease HI [Clostridia bacterium]
MKQIDIYTDGACSGNPGVGGWGAILMYKGATKEISGAEPDTTNNRMELQAIISALKALKEPCLVNLYSDSSYALNAFLEGWIGDWEKKGWRTASNKEVKNIDLWQELIALTKIHTLTWIKVKGHSDNQYNNRCDLLARTAIKNYK